MNVSAVNVLIIGQTGVGKSSLINYIMREPQLLKTGTGFPVTAKGFHLTTGIVGNAPIHLYDSWGLELGAFEEWLKSLKSFIAKSGDALDCVFFCINSNSHRIQQAELDVMNYLISKQLHINIIFTKYSPASEQSVRALQAAITAEIPVVRQFFYINSVKETFMSGDQLEAFGFDSLQQFFLHIAAEKNLPYYKAAVKETLLTLVEDEQVTQSNLKAELIALLTKHNLSLLEIEQASWRDKLSEKASPIFKKVGAVKRFVTREQSTRSHQEVIVDTLLRDEIIVQQMREALMKELMEGSE